MSDIAKYKEEVYRIAYPQNSSYWAQGRIDQRFKAGDQDLWNEMIGSSKYRSKYQFFFNFIRRQVNMVVGYYRQHRKSTIVTAQRQDAEIDADDMTQVMMHAYNKMKYYEIDAKCFEGAVTAGQDFIHLYKDTRYDQVSGDLAVDHVGFQNILVDPWYRKIDLSDCNYLWRRKWVSDEGISRIMPEDDIDKSILKKKGSRDGKFTMQSQALGSMVEMMNYVDEFYYMSTRKAIMMTNIMNGDRQEWVGDMKEAEQIAMLNPWMRIDKQEIPTVKLCTSVNGIDVYEGENQLGIDRYPFAPYLCYHEPDISSYAWKTQGIVRGLRHAQYLYNRRKIIEFDILESQPNSGYIYKPTDLVNPKEVFKTGQGQGIALKKDADATSLNKIEPPAIPPSVIELSRSLSADMLQISGINEELLGAADDDKAGILSQLRQAAGLTTLQTIFDQADMTKQIFGEIFTEAVQKNYTTAKVSAILGHEPRPSFFDTNTLRFGVEVEEGIYSVTQRQMALRTAAYYREQLGIPIPDKFFIDNANLPKKQEILEDMEQEQKQAQEQQQAMMESEQRKSQIDEQYKMSQTAEKMSNAELKQAETKKTLEETETASVNQDYKGAETLLLLQDLNNMVNNQQEVTNVG